MTTLHHTHYALIASLLLLGACSGSDATSDQPTAEAVDTALELPTCEYDNPFSRNFECKEYLGSWPTADVEADCGEIFTGVAGEVGLGTCDRETALGTCSVDIADGQSSITYYYGGDLEVTASMCQSFLNGVWEGEDGPQAAPPTGLDRALAAMVSTQDVTVSPECTDDTCVADLAAAQEGIWFRPTNTEPTTAVVFYPGGGVDPRAYAPAAHLLAHEGFTVVIVPMPGNFAFNGYQRATLMMAAEPSIQSWFIAGHSAGGASAVTFATESRAELSGLILLAAYGSQADDLSSTSLPVVSIFGTHDGVVTLDEVEAGKNILPSDTLYVPLTGANHAQFGYYGDQDGDAMADISPDHQHALFTSAMIHFINTTLAPEELPQHPGFAAAAAVGNDWCKNGQVMVAGLENDDGINVITSENTEAYSETKPVITDESIEVHAFSRQGPNASELRAPSVITGEIWCKMKSREALPASTPTSGEPTTCKAINEAALEWAITQLSPEEAARFEREAPTLLFEDDAIYETGFEWVQDSVVEFDGERVQAPRLTVGLDRTDLPEPYRGVHYCKVWSPAHALLWALSVE